MKLLYLTLLLLTVTSFTLAAPVIRAIGNNGKWDQASTWNLNRTPQSGDTVIIPVNLQVVLDNNESLDNLVVKITGILKLNNGKLILNSASRIDIMIGGRLTGSGNNDQVKIGGDFKFRGGFDLPILGPAYADTSTGTSPNGFVIGLSLLGERTTDFTVSRVNGNACISWTSVPGNTIQFDIEKSLNGISWSIAGTVPVGGDRGSRQHYSYIDKNLTAATAYYRIKQVLPSGVAYTAVKTISNKESAGMDVYAGSRHTVNVRFNVPVTFPVKMMVMDLNGRVVQQQSFGTPGSAINLQLKSVTTGTMIVNVSDAAGGNRSRIVVL